MIRPVLAAHKRLLVTFVLWCLLGALPVLLSGRLIAAAVDVGFLAGSAVNGLLLLGSYGAVIALGSFATRQAIRPMSVIVEAVRDHLVRSVVRGTLHTAVREDRPAESGSVARLTRQTEQVRQLLAGLLMALRTVAFSLVAAMVGLLTLAPLVGIMTVPALVACGLVVASLSREWRKRYADSLACEEQLSGRLAAVLPALRDVHACAAAGRTTGEVTADIATHVRTARGAAVIGAARVGVVSLSARMPLVALLLAAPWLVSSGALSTGEVVGAATYLISGLEPALRSLMETVANMGLQLSTILRRLAAHAAEPQALVRGIRSRAATTWHCARSRFATVRIPTRYLTGSSWISGTVSTSRSWGRAESASPPWPRCCAALSSRMGARCLSEARRCTGSNQGRYAAAWSSFRRRRTCSAARCGTTSVITVTTTPTI